MNQSRLGQLSIITLALLAAACGEGERAMPDAAVSARQASAPVSSTPASPVTSASDVPPPAQPAAAATPAAPTGAPIPIQAIRFGLLAKWRHPMMPVKPKTSGRDANNGRFTVARIDSVSDLYDIQGAHVDVQYTDTYPAYAMMPYTGWSLTIPYIDTGDTFTLKSGGTWFSETSGYYAGSDLIHLSGNNLTISDMGQPDGIGASWITEPGIPQGNAQFRLESIDGRPERFRICRGGHTGEVDTDNTKRRSGEICTDHFRQNGIITGAFVRGLDGQPEYLWSIDEPSPGTVLSCQDTRKIQFVNSVNGPLSRYKRLARWLDDSTTVDWVYDQTYTELPRTTSLQPVTSDTVQAEGRVVISGIDGTQPGDRRVTIQNREIVAYHETFADGNQVDCTLTPDNRY